MKRFISKNAARILMLTAIVATGIAIPCLNENVRLLASVKPAPTAVCPEDNSFPQCSFACINCKATYAADRHGEVDHTTISGICLNCGKSLTELEL